MTSNEPASAASPTPTPAPQSGGPHTGDTPPRRPRRIMRTIALAIMVALLGFAGGVAGFAFMDARSDNDSGTNKATLQPSNTSPSSDSADVTKVAEAAAGMMTPGAIYKQDAPGVVHITAQVTVDGGTSIFGMPSQQKGEATGSGFVIDHDGHIVTNAHVVEGATSVSVSFSDDSKVDAKIIGQDLSTDIAVLKVNADAEALKHGLRPLKFGDSSKVTVGDPVVAIGNPYNLDRTLTTGVVSALQRQIPALNQFAIDNVIQTDAAINPGNSGGPLLNMQGDVIGVNSQIQSKSGGFDGIAFAVPSATVERVSSQLIKNGSVKHAWLGLSGKGVSADLADLLSLPVDEGVLVGEVTKGSPADKAGLKGGDKEAVIDGSSYLLGGDIITKFGGKKVTDMSQIAEAVNAKKPGEKAKVEFYHRGKKHTVQVKLGNRPETSDRSQ